MVRLEAFEYTYIKVIAHSKLLLLFIPLDPYYYLLSCVCFCFGKRRREKER